MIEGISQYSSKTGSIGFITVKDKKMFSVWYTYGNPVWDGWLKDFSKMKSNSTGFLLEFKY